MLKLIYCHSTATSQDQYIADHCIECSDENKNIFTELKSLNSIILSNILSYADLSVKMPSRVGKRKTEEEVKEAAVSSAKKAGSGESPEYSHWLIKSEPESRFENGVDMKFGIDDLRAEPDSTACWDGVRNYSARNNMKTMKVGQQAFFYHSNTKPPGIVGIVDIVKEFYVDHTQFDKKDPHYDPKSKKVTTELRTVHHNNVVFFSGRSKMVHG